MPTFEEIYRARKEHVDRIQVDSVHAYYELMVARFIVFSASLPFALGSLLAFDAPGSFNLPVFLISSLAVFLIMGAVNAGNTYYDYELDKDNWDFSVYSGGIRVLVEERISKRKRALYCSLGLLVVAFALGLLLYFGFHTGPWTLALGMVGRRWPAGSIPAGRSSSSIAAWASWSSPPARACSPSSPATTSRSARSVGTLAPLALGLAFSILNGIVINEFPDMPADARNNKRTFVVRFGKVISARFYLFNVGVTALSFLSAPAVGHALVRGLAGPAAGIAAHGQECAARGRRRASGGHQRRHAGHLQGACVADARQRRRAARRRPAATRLPGSSRPPRSHSSRRLAHAARENTLRSP